MNTTPPTQGNRIEWIDNDMATRLNILDGLRPFVGRTVILSLRGFPTDDSLAPVKDERTYIAFLVDQRKPLRLRLWVQVTAADGIRRLYPIDVQPGCIVTVDDKGFQVWYGHSKEIRAVIST